MQIVLKRTEKASPTKIDLRTSFLGIRRDPPASFRIHSETHIFFTERISFVVHFENSHGFQVERAKKVGDRNKREKMKAKRLIVSEGSVKIQQDRRLVVFFDSYASIQRINGCAKS